VCQKGRIKLNLPIKAAASGEVLIGLRYSLNPPEIFKINIFKSIIMTFEQLLKLNALYEEIERLKRYAACIAYKVDGKRAFELEFFIHRAILDCPDFLNEFLSTNIKLILTQMVNKTEEKIEFLENEFKNI
jgi:hypothetical protein